MKRRSCAWCDGPIPARARRDALTCSQRCRQARHRVTRYAVAGRDASRQAQGDVSRVDRALQARRLAYADPPYPGKSHYYRGHPDYAGEVDHAELLSRLATYDGWALSTSARALPDVLALAVAQGLAVRVAAWIRGARPHATARYPLNAWEPVVYVPVASAGERDASCGSGRRVDTLMHGVSPMLTLPGRVIGTKPAAFCRWVFDLVGATPDDRLDDLFPGSGMVARTWQAYASRDAGDFPGDGGGRTPAPCFSLPPIGPESNSSEPITRSDHEFARIRPPEGRP
jgi:hypothetical protein